MHITFMKVDSVDVGKLNLPTASHRNKTATTVYSALASEADIDALLARRITVVQFREGARVAITEGEASVQPNGSDADKSFTLYLTAKDLEKLGADRAGSALAQRGGGNVAAAYTLAL
jgi:hypothetical protein